MSLTTIRFGTGPATLPDNIGELSYNGLTFSPLFSSSIEGAIVKDEAGRVTKYMEYTITVDGYVTVNDLQRSIVATVGVMRQNLTEPGATLIYKGRGFDLTVNLPGQGIGIKDAAWGPYPELFEFQPLGGGLSAKVRWQVKVRISEKQQVLGGNLAAIPLLQFCYDTSVTYAEDGFSSITTTGVIEIPMTRIPTVNTFTLTQTVDDIRNIIDKRILVGIDLSRFRISNREFTISKDKRTLTWTMTAEETPYQNMPPFCTIARGSYTVAPAKAGMGLCNWLCTLRATYTVRKDAPRRTAWIAFLALLRLRMAQANVPGQAPILDADEIAARLRQVINPAQIALAKLGLVDLKKKVNAEMLKIMKEQATRAFLVHFSFDEGLYLDSKTVSFTASWRLITTFNNILLASGLWKKLPETAAGINLWAIAAEDISGSQSWLQNKVDPKLDLIIDFGS